MHQSVKACLGYQLTLEHIVPVCDGQLACQDECPAVVPVVDDLLEIMLYLTFEPDHAEVVDDEQVVGRELTEEVGLTPFQVYQPQLVDERVHSEVERLVALSARHFSKGVDKESLARSCRSYHDDGPAITYVAARCVLADISCGQPARGVYLQFLTRLSGSSDLKSRPLVGRVPENMRKRKT